MKHSVPSGDGRNELRSRLIFLSLAVLEASHPCIRNFFRQG